MGVGDFKWNKSWAYYRHCDVLDKTDNIWGLWIEDPQKRLLSAKDYLNSLSKRIVNFSFKPLVKFNREKK